MKANPLSFGVISAILFGISTPISKVLLRDIAPFQLAGVLYLGAGLGLLLYRGKGLIGRRTVVTTGLTREDYPSLIGSIISGGVLAPISLMVGLSVTTAAESSLLLNFEAAATVIIAGILFKEHVGKRIGLTVILFTVGAIVLSFDPSREFLLSPGSLLVLLACIFWGLDNNLSRRISVGDPTFIVMVKGLCAGSFTFFMSVALTNEVPPIVLLLIGAVVGAVCYGLSLVFFILSLREVGSARTGALFSIAPFIGMLASILIFLEVPSWQLVLSLPLMIAGLTVMIGESHIHPHEHEPLRHSHSHDHLDRHHTHGTSVGRHTHHHVHDPITHSHVHLPDIHHRHRHGK